VSDWAAKWIGGDFQSPPKGAGDVALCGGCLAAGRCRLGVVSEQLDEDQTASFEVVVGPEHEGGPGVAHGGWTSSIFAEILGHVPLLLGHTCVTGTLTVHYVKPIPIERRLLARAWVDRREAEKWFVSGELLLAASGALLATGTGVMIERSPEVHFGGFHQWLKEQGDD
jgi:acyl-coenzyme A thioesterase PaaI-like protein